MKKRMMALGLALCALLACAAALAAPARAEGDGRKLTLMLYMCGSTLESEGGSASADIMEIIDSGFDPSQTSVVVMAGGSSSWTLNLKSDKLTLLELKNTGRVPVGMEEGASMGKPETLLRLLDFAHEEYPAERYALILWDHGTGPLGGVCLDDLYAPDRLSLDDLTQALEASPFAREKLAWIGFDACLMSSVEVASRMAPFADYMVASQAQEPGSGWNYGFLRDIDKDADFPETARRIVDMYLETPQKNPIDLTMACVDLSAIGEVEAGMDAMFGAIAQTLDEENFPELSMRRFEATAFGKGVGDNVRTSGYDLVDLVSLGESYAGLDPEGAEAVREAVSRAVVYNRSQVKGGSGLSVYHPYRNREEFKAAWRAAYSALGFCPGYAAYVDAYGRIMAGVPLTQWTGLTQIEALSHQTELGATESVISLRLTEAQAANLASARLVVLGRNLYDWQDDAFFRVYTSADVAVDGSVLMASYAGSSLQILDAAGMEQMTSSISYGVTEDGVYVLKLYPFDEDGVRREEPIYAEYRMDDSGRLVPKGYFIEDALLGALSPRGEIDLSQYRGITFRNEYRVPTTNEAGELLAFDAWEEDAHRDTQWRARRDIDRTDFVPSFALEPLMAEDLYAAFEITDTQGNTYMSERVPLDGGPVPVEAQASFTTDMPSVDAWFYADREAGALTLVLEVENRSDAEQLYTVGDIALNGVPLEGAVGMLYGGTGTPEREGGAAPLKPGEAGSVLLRIDAAMLEGLDVGDALRQLTGTLLVSLPGGDTLGYMTHFAVNADIPLGAVLSEEDAPDQAYEYYEDVELVIPALDGAPLRYGAMTFIQQSQFAENSRLIFNMVLENTSRHDIVFTLLDIAVNGVPVSTGQLSAEGTGGLTPLGRGSVAPGERSSVSVALRWEDLEPLLPDVAVESIECRLAISRVEADGYNTSIVMPVVYTLEAPLTAFCQEADVLPSPALVEAGREMGALDEAGAVRLFSAMDCEAYLQGFFLTGRSCVLLLRCENHAGEERAMFLGGAAMDGEPAAMGRSTNAFVTARNNIVRSLGADLPLWEESAGVRLYLEPGETRYAYVTVRPLSDGKDSVRSLGFDAYIFEDGASNHNALVEGIAISTEEAGPLVEGIDAVAPAEDYVIQEGHVVEGDGAEDVLAAEVRVTGEPKPIEITFNPPDGGAMEIAYYALLRRVRSETELSGLNLLNTNDPQTSAATVSFGHGREWLLYELAGDLALSPDGTEATAVFPGLVPALRTSEGTVSLNMARITDGGDGLLDFTAMENVQFLSGKFPSAVLYRQLSSVQIACDPGNLQAEMKHFNVTSETAAPAGLAVKDAWLLPADSDAGAMTAFLRDYTGGTKLYQLLPMAGEALEPVLLPLEDPEDYLISFLYRPAGGVATCTAPAPLVDFINSGAGVDE
ncbi:MAG: clostripain-related cysteine peptidase [Clostridia bacterium]|nr:clostripain-related cysteine peptidase [Clostridia bacterium]